MLRAATPGDLSLLRYWDTKPHVIAASGDDGFLDWESELQRNPDWRELMIAESDGRPIGMIQIIDPAREETHYWGEVEAGLRAIDIWIGEEADLGRGLGTQMMRAALERCFADPAVKAVLLDPLATNTRAHRFYERLGFEPIEGRGSAPMSAWSIAWSAFPHVACSRTRAVIANLRAFRAREPGMQNTYDLWTNPWTYFVIAGLFVWLIPLWHSLRSGSVLAIVEVLLLLAISVALPILVFTFTAALGEFAGRFGALGALQAVAGSSLLWFAALMIGLAADIGGQFRRGERRKTYAAAMPDYPRNV